MICVFFFFKQKTAYEMLRSLVGSEMCIRDRHVMDASELTVERAMLLEADSSTVWVLNKADLVTARELASLQEAGVLREAVTMSCATMEGQDQMLEELTARVSARLGVCTAESDAPVITRARHRGHLKKCLESLRGFDEVAESEAEIGAEELRMALRELGSVTGHVGVEELLGVVFSEFCIGK
eukprot:TRINITY_DN56157_c0_g1_i1.p1 TRINITY_DN56157_c0_g1~~TRINITY_DN56157_c0_g1_i1.p1  ORF type:complete len:183 (+),score=71.08 TRINITY_DN56157_c0_g1_i1:62-610(+)